MIQSLAIVTVQNALNRNPFISERFNYYQRSASFFMWSDLKRNCVTSKPLRYEFRIPSTMCFMSSKRLCDLDLFFLKNGWNRNGLRIISCSNGWSMITAILMHTQTNSNELWHEFKFEQCKHVIKCMLKWWWNER